MLKSGFIPGKTNGSDRMRLQMAFIGSWIVVAAATVLAFRMPVEAAGAQRLDHVAGFLVGYALCAGAALLLARLLLHRVWSLRLGYLLCAFAALTGLGIGLNLSGYCSFPGTWLDPDLGDWTDATRDWHYAEKYMATGQLSPYAANGYIVLSGTLMKIFGCNVAVPLLANLLFAFGTVAATGYLCAIFFPRRAKEAAFRGALAVACVGSLAWYGSIFQKDAGVAFGFALCGIAAAKLLKERFDTALVVCGAAGGLLLMLLKGPMGWFLIVGICAVCARFCRKAPQRYRRLYCYGIYMLLVSAAIIAGGRHWRQNDPVERVAGGAPAEFAQGMAGYQTVERYAELIPGYFQAPPAERIVKIPLAAAAQYFPPFPWNYTRDTSLGKFVWIAHINWAWYLIGGAALGYLILCAFRRRKGGDMERWAIWFAVCYLGMAYYSGGTVARYLLPLVPLAVPMAMQFSRCVRERLLSRRKALVYCVTYCVMLAAGLVSAYVYLKG